MPPPPFHQAVERAGSAGGNGLVIEEPLQVVGQGLGRRVALGGQLGGGFQQDRFQVERNVRIDGARRARLGDRDLPYEHPTVRIVEGRFERQ